MRPVRLLPGIQSALRHPPAVMAWVVIRENTEGEYAGLGGRNLHGRGPSTEIAIQSSLVTEEGCERIMRFASRPWRARGRARRSPASPSPTPSNTVWCCGTRYFAGVAHDYPDVETDQGLVDAMAARFVLRPDTLEVVVASNLFADILSDLGGALVGGLGIAASANLNPERRYPSMFEPVHGSAPDIAGRGIANPIGAIWSAAMMLEHLGLPAQADRVLRAVEATTAAGQVTPDLGGRARRRATSAKR